MFVPKCRILGKKCAVGSGGVVVAFGSCVLRCKQPVSNLPDGTILQYTSYNPNTKPQPHVQELGSLLVWMTAMKASCGMCTLPMSRMRFLPLACFCSSFFLRLTSPP
jgi:hypothetical protein